MKKVQEVSKVIGVSKRTLQYYDEIGLLPPTKYTESGYRLYDEKALEKLWEILLLRELGYQLKDIKIIISDPNYDMRESIGQQIEILTKKKKRIENLIGYAKIIKIIGVIPFNFEAFGDITFDEFIEDSKNSWNINTMMGYDENDLNYKFLKKIQDVINEELDREKEWSEDEVDTINNYLLEIADYEKILEFAECIEGFKDLTDKDVISEEVQLQVKKIFDTINSLLEVSMSVNGFSLYGKSFASGGDIGLINSKRLGEETTDFIGEAIQIYCDNLNSENQ